MDNWNFTGKPDVPAWPKDAQGQDEKAVLLTQTFDSPADTDMIISPAGGLRHPLLQVLRSGRRRGEGHQRLFRLRRQPVCARKRSWRRQRTCWPPGRWRTRKRKNTPERSF